MGHHLKEFSRSSTWVRAVIAVHFPVTLPCPLFVGGYYSTDQLLNVAAFSTLRRWLLATIASGGGAAGHSPGGAGSVSATPTLELTNQVTYSSFVCQDSPF